MRSYVAVLRIPDYRRLWTGLVLNLLGDGATFTAMAWITVDLAGAAGLGVLGVCYTLPVLLGAAVPGLLTALRFRESSFRMGAAPNAQPTSSLAGS